MNHNNYHSPCQFSASLVSYLYEEIDAPEKSRFEAHLKNCAACAGEVFAFGEIRSSIGQWRENDFAALATPAFGIDLSASEADSQDAQTPAKNSWLANLRDLFVLSPAWTRAATACAALAICAVLFYAMFSARQNEGKLAEADQRISTPEITSPVIEISKSPISANVADSRETPKSTMPAFKIESKSEPPKPMTIGMQKSAAVKSSALKQIKNTAPPKLLPREKRSNVRKLPADAEIEFSSREDEDESLRLADLFDEVSMK